MKKVWMILFLVMTLGSSMYIQAAVKKIEVTYNGEPMPLEQAPIIRHGKVWLPIKGLFKDTDYTVEYKENCVYFSGKHIPMTTVNVVKADSKEDDGSYAILLNNMVYVSVHDLGEHLKKDVKWDQKTKKISISSIIPLAALGEGPEGELKYDTDTGDFYNGKMLIANLPMDHMDWVGADKLKTDSGHVLYQIENCYGEPHVNSDLYAVYAVNGGLHIARSYKFNMNGTNSMIADNKVALIDKNVISVYDDVTGNLIKRHTINGQPLKQYISAQYDAEYVEELFNSASNGYMIEGVGDDFVLYKNYELKTLTFLNLKDGQEIELYKKVCSPEDIAGLDKGPRDEGDCLQFVKAENGVIYLKHVYTEETYQYQYK